MLGFLQCQRARPPVVPDTITGDDRARPVTPMLAVDEDWGRQAVNDRQRLSDLFMRWPRNAIHRHVGIDNSVGGSLGLLPFPCLIAHAQVEDGLDAQLLEVLDPNGVGLGPAIEAVIHLAEVNNAFAGRHPALPRAGRVSGGEEQNYYEQFQPMCLWAPVHYRSEERRGGKEGRCWWSP